MNIKSVLSEIRTGSQDGLTLSKMAKIKSLLTPDDTKKVLAGIRSNTGQAVIIESTESRGFQTQYARKCFLYILGKDSKNKLFVKGITKDSRLKNLRQLWIDSGFEFEVFDDEKIN